MPYISKVKLPGDTTIYDIKDQEARDLLAQVSNYTHYLGVTSTAITDGGTAGNISIGGTTWTKGTEYSEENHVYTTGCIVTANNATSYTPDEFICSTDGKWQKFGNLGDLGALAYKDSASGSYTPSVTGSKGTLAVASKTIAAADVAVTLSTTAITGATSFKAVNTLGNITYGYSISSATFTGTSATVSVAGTATQTSAAITLTGGTTKVFKVSVPQNTWVTGASYSKATAATATGGAATVGSATVYGLEGSTTTYMTTSETLSPVNATVFRAVSKATTVSAINASVAVTDEILTFTAVTPLSSVTFSTYSVLSATTTLTTGTQKTATAYTVGKSGATTFTQPTITITNTKTAADLTKVASSSLALYEATGGTTLATALHTGGYVDIAAAVEASGDYTPSGTVSVVLSTSTASAVTAVSTFYGKVNIPAHTHNHTLSGDIVVTPNAKTVTVS